MLYSRWPLSRVLMASSVRTRFAAPVRTFAAASEYVRSHTQAKGEPIHEADAAQSAGLQTLASRLKIQDIPYATLARTLVSDTSTLKYANNAGLAKFGRTLLSFYVYEHFMAKFPRLPTSVLKHLVEVYTGVKPLSEVGNTWGVQSDTRSPLTRYLAAVPDEQALGRLAYTEQHQEIEHNVTELLGRGTATHETAMGVFVRALVAAVYAHRGVDGAREFVHQYIIKPRKIDMLSIMAFSRPTRELAVLCAREGLEAPVSRLMAESGRFSASSVFVVGVFSGSSKLGEGQGASLREARTRAAVNALQSWYLYSPVVSQGASELYVDPGQVVI